MLTAHVNVTNLLCKRIPKKKNIQENLNIKIDIKVSSCQISEKWKPIRVREG